MTLGVNMLFDEGVLAAQLPAIDSVRMRRNKLLANADMVYCNAEQWEQMTEQQKQAWRAYKQALRDLPATCSPDDPVWPELPL
jgi:pyridoxal/pyridoxine/pyridoxamine kinase